MVNQSLFEFAIVNWLSSTCIELKGVYKTTSFPLVPIIYTSSICFLHFFPDLPKIVKGYQEVHSFYLYQHDITGVTQFGDRLPHSSERLRGWVRLFYYVSSQQSDLKMSKFDLNWKEFFSWQWTLEIINCLWLMSSKLKANT